ncbi:MAG: SGNH/GDSL hydrolase family protein [Porphyromonadaceae bacterium]|jgi:lysophospholipase L1-like esterase|nr:SGNH/GDSL hydrolase family protein [Porphyromonadaceae bacterium]
MKKIGLFLIIILAIQCTERPGNNHLLIIGDSNGAAKDGWVTELMKLRAYDLFLNLSIAGNTIGFDNLDKDTLNTKKNIASYLERGKDSLERVDKILIWLGTNDCKTVFKDNQDVVINNLDTILSIIDAYPFKKKPRVYLIAPTPFAPDSLLSEKYHGGEERLSRLIPQMAETAQRRDVPFLNLHDSILAEYPQMHKDGVHLNEYGAAKAAKIINTFIHENK